MRSSTAAHPVSKTGESKSRKSNRERKKQLSLTNQWLEENYCICDGVCIPRCILYSHYIDFCHTHSLSPACAATFGKVIRQKFPNITTRRLGTRGHSKYHYYGICIKQTSQYYQSLYSGSGLTRFSGSKFISEAGFTRKYCLSSKAGSILPEFPSCYRLTLPATVDGSKLETLLVMYRVHCQSVLDTIVSAHFFEVPNHLLHFWQELPAHLEALLQNELVIRLLTYCDSILFNSLIDILIPSTMQEVSESLLADVQRLANSWEAWTSQSLTGMPLPLVSSKLNGAQLFAQALRRQATFLRLAQMVRPILYDCRMVNQLVLDVNNVQFDSTSNSQQIQVENELLVQIKEVLHRQATVEAFMEWLDAIISQRVVKPCSANRKLFTIKVRSFLDAWSIFGTELMQCLTIQKAASLTSLNLLKLLLDEYIMVAIESQMYEQTMQDWLFEINQLAATPLPHATDRMLLMPFSNQCNTGTASMELKPLSAVLGQSSSGHTVLQQTPNHTQYSYQTSCKYAASYQGQISSYPEQWNYPYPSNTAAATWQPMANIPYTNCTARDVSVHLYNGQPTCTSAATTDFTMADGEEQHLPSIGHVLC